MKNHFFSVLILLFSALFFSSCSEQEQTTEDADSEVINGFSIQANIDSISSEKAYLTQYKAGGFIYYDSTAIVDGAFSFEGEIDSPEMYYITFNNNVYNRINIFLENDVFNVTGSNLERENLDIQGGPLHEAYDEFYTEDIKYDEEIGKAIGVYNEGEENDDKALMDKGDSLYDAADLKRATFIEDYINTNGGSLVAGYVLSRNYYRYELEKLEAFYKGFSDEVKGSTYGEAINEKITALQNSAIGREAPLFSMNDVNGNAVNLEDFRGNYLLVDFWASWCGPCRAENPNVVQAYKKYNGNGFEILGISLDSEKADWLEAIDADKLTWTHVSDLNSWDCEAVELYGVSAIPHSVLIDPSGIIVAKDLREEALFEKLEEIYP